LTLFYIDVFGAGIIWGNFVEDAMADIQSFTVSFIRLDEEVIDDKATSSRVFFASE
jgi:hypothetical protein